MSESQLVDKLQQEKNTKKIDDADLTRIKELRDEYKSQTVKIGQFNVERILMNQAVERLNKAIEESEIHYSKLQEKERSLVKELQEKYGIGQLNLDTGTFSPIKSK